MSVIYIASDHAGFQLKDNLKQYAIELGYEVIDLGPQSEASVDYPDFAHKMAHEMAKNPTARGVLLCGSGIGISIAANRHPHIRAALCHDHFTARACRLHNDANVLAMGARVIGLEIARDCLKTFLETEFEGGRHQSRIDKINL